MLAGLNNVLASEVVPGVLPLNQNNPQQVRNGLYTEQISGTSFTKPRSTNRSVWVYRLQPSCATNDGFKPLDLPAGRDAKSLSLEPSPVRWDPVEPSSPTADFVMGLRMYGEAGNPLMGEGLAIYSFGLNKSMRTRSVSFHDGEVLIVPQSGKLEIKTELGVLSVEPEMIAVIPRGIKFSVEIESESHWHSGYMVEVYNEGGFRLPELGPIGANGLANPLHFEHPTAWIDETLYPSWENIIRFGGEWFIQDRLPHSPFNVVAWKGNYLPYRYDLRKFVTINTVSVDHPDPSIFTVLTVPSQIPGIAACDFVIFPPRWMVAEKTFRPPYFHKNVMCEFMGLIKGKYDGKKGGFVPGGASLHNRFVAHGPDKATFENASHTKLEPVHYDGGLAFMFETAYVLKLSDFARHGDHRQMSYSDCWQGFARAKL